MVERELGMGSSELGVGRGPSAAVEDGDSAWEDIEEDEDLAAAMARKDEIDNGEIVGEVKEQALSAYSDYAVITGRKVSYISMSTEDFTDKVTRNRLATVQSGPDRGLFWRLLKRLDCTVQSFVRLDWTVPKDRTVRR